LAQAGALAHQLGQALDRCRAPGHRVVMAAVGGEHVVVGPQRGTGADRDRLLARGQVRGALDQAGKEQVVGGLLGGADQRHLLVQREQLIGLERAGAGIDGGHWVPPGGRLPLSSPRPAAVFRCDWLSRSVLSSPPAVQYLRPATSSSSAGNFVMISHPDAVTTTSSSMRAADQPSAAGQYVSSAKTMPSSSTSGGASETHRLKIGFPHIDRPTPCP